MNKKTRRTRRHGSFLKKMLKAFSLCSFIQEHGEETFGFFKITPLSSVLIIQLRIIVNLNGEVILNSLLRHLRDTKKTFSPHSGT